MARPKTKNYKKEICKQLSLGKPIQDVLNPEKEDYVPVLWEQVVTWLKTDELFRLDYDQSRIFGADYLADEMLGLVRELKDDPKKAPSIKAAMEILKWQTMVRNSKYSERTIQETKTSGPMDPQKVKAEKDRLVEELKLVKK